MNIPFDRPIIGPTQFVETNVPPVTINIPGFPQSLMYAVPRITAMMLNRACEIATANPGRTACFNALVINNFQNPNLSDWVNIALRIAFDKASKAGNPNNLEPYLNDAAGEALSYFASILTTTTPEIYVRSNPQVQGAANANTARFNEYKNTLFNLNFSTVSHPVAGNYNQSYAVANQPPQYGQPVQQSTWGGAAPVPAAVAVPTAPLHTTWGQAPAPQQEAPALKQAAWFNNEQSSYATPTTPPVINNTQDFLRATNEVPASAPTVPVVAGPFVSYPLTPTLVQKGHEMDINTHAIPYFGSEKLLDMSNRRDDMKLDIFQITREGRRAENSTAPILLGTNLDPEISVDSAVYMARAAMKLARNPETTRLYRQFFNVLNPTICTETSQKIMGMFGGHTGFYELPAKFKYMVDQMTDPNNPSEEDQQVINFLAYLDRKLAVAVNNFLKYNLRVGGVRMRTFSDSIDDLRSSLQQSMGDRHAQALDVWGTRFLSSLREHCNENAEKFLSDYFGDTSLFSGYFPTVISVTLLQLTAKELGYDATFEGTEIDPKMTHVLYDLASSLHRNKKDLAVFTTTDLVVTADDIRYIVSEDALSPGRYLLYRTE